MRPRSLGHFISKVDAHSSAGELLRVAGPELGLSDTVALSNLGHEGDSRRFEVVVCVDIAECRWHWCVAQLTARTVTKCHMLLCALCLHLESGISFGRVGRGLPAGQSPWT